MKQTRAIRPDAQAFDEVRISTVPRFKMSGLSGDEWRISALIQLYRKGKVVHEQVYRNVETAARFLDYVVAKAIDDGKAYYAGEGNTCDQEGCFNDATVIYKLKKRFCSSCGESREAGYKLIQESIEIRKFCAKHSKRGDCGLDDADRNYELLEGVVELPDEEAMSPSQRVNVAVNSIDGIPEALKNIRKELKL